MLGLRLITGGKAKKTAYERLQAEKAGTEAMLQRWQAALDGANEDLDRVLRQGGDPSAALQAVRAAEEGKQLAERQLAVAEQALRAAEPEYVRSEIQRLAKQRAEMLAQGAREADEYEEARRRFYDLEERFRANAQMRGFEAERIAKRIAQLEARLAELEAQAPGA